MDAHFFHDCLPATATKAAAAFTVYLSVRYHVQSAAKK